MKLCLFAAALFFLLMKGIGAQKSPNLSWKYSIEDKAEFTLESLNVQKWRSFAAHSSLYSTGRDIFWLRGHKTLPAKTLPAQKQKLAFFFEKVCGHLELYVNGRPVKQQERALQFHSRCYRSAIYPLPLSFNKLQKTKISIAIRLSKSNYFRPPALYSQVALMELQEAEKDLWSSNLSGLLYAFLSLILGAFFLGIYMRLYQAESYKAFASFLLFYAAYKLLQSELVYSIIDLSPYFSRASICLGIMLPYLAYSFFIRFFLIERIQIKLPFFKLDKDAQEWGYFYFRALAGTAFICLLFPNLTHRLYLVELCFFLQLPVMLYFLFISAPYFRSLHYRSIGALGALPLCLSIVLHIVHPAAQNPFSPAAGAFMFVLQLSLALALLYHLVMKRKEVESHKHYLASIDAMQDRIFNYMGAVFAKSAREVVDLSRKYIMREERKIKQEELGSLSLKISEMQFQLGDIMELARLESLPKPENLEKLKLKEFVQTFVSQADISCHIRVDEKLEITSSMEFLNTAFLHLLDFLKRQGTQHIDLLVKPKNKHEILFHFLSFHSDEKKIKELYRICKSEVSLRDARWITWSIIKESMRILRSQISVLVNGSKFLRFAITIPVDINLQESYRLEDSSAQETESISLVLHGTEEKNKEDDTAARALLAIRQGKMAQRKGMGLRKLRDWLPLLAGGQSKK